jgi:DNA-binding NtrC family response regulator
MVGPAGILRALIVHEDGDLAGLWSRFLQREGLVCRVACSADEAIELLRAEPFDAIILDVEMRDAAIAVSDFAGYRHPGIPVIAVTARTFFSDGAVFELMPNALNLQPAAPRLPDLAAVVAHYGSRYRAAERLVECPALGIASR